MVLGVCIRLTFISTSILPCHQVVLVPYLTKTLSYHSTSTFTIQLHDETYVYRKSDTN
jgi:hypothetical protein